MSNKGNGPPPPRENDRSNRPVSPPPPVVPFDEMFRRLRAAGGDAWDKLDVDQEIAAMRGQPQGTEARVCDDITERQAMGIAKYGTTVEKNNATLREWLQHAYEEALDMAVYLKRAIEKMDDQL